MLCTRTHDPLLSVYRGNLINFSVIYCHSLPFRLSIFDESKTQNIYRKSPGFIALTHACLFQELQALEVVRFMEDVQDDDMALLSSAEFYGAAIISCDAFRQICYVKYAEGKSRRIHFRFFKNPPHISDLHKPEMVVDMFVDLRYRNFESMHSEVVFKKYICSQFQML